MNNNKCTGVTASWCPVHGDCTCPRKLDGEREEEDPKCPLHSLSSSHAQNLETIEEIEKLASLPEDWDGDGATPIGSDTIRRTIEILERQAKLCMHIERQEISAPDVGHCADGSIDLHWKTDEFELLMNIPSESDKPATFYGDDYSGCVVKGTLRISSAKVKP